MSLPDLAPHLTGHQESQFWLATGVFLATFILEDVATIGAGLLLAAGALAWPAALGSCFLGIWLGDAGLYGLARFAGRPWFERSSLRRHAHRVQASEGWFQRKGSAILIFSRMVPGARLPTYLAAGFLRLPAGRFLLVTGLAALVWTFCLLTLTRALGSQALVWLGAFRHAIWPIIFLFLLFWLAWGGLSRLGSRSGRRRLATAMARWRHWEFWPAWAFSPPVVATCAWLACKYRGVLLPTAANPGIFSGGMVGESKMATLRDLLATSPEFTAEAELLTGSTPTERFASLQRILTDRQIPLPYILKPDQGQRGVGIKLVRETAQAIAYLESNSAPVLVQRYAPGPGELGVFYYRFPQEEQGHIFAITEKIFPTITGDGHATIEELVWRDPRARFLADKYLARLAGRTEEVLEPGVNITLVQAGNHAQGCIFRDGMHLNTPALTAQIDQISRRLAGFFIGRYDLRYADESELRAGRGFQIIELNGAASEATSIYDARNSLLTAYRVLFRQWELVYAIGAANRARGCAPTSARELWRAWRAFGRLSASYPPAD